MIDSELDLAAVRVLSRYFRLLDEEAFEVGRVADVFADDGVIRRPNGTSMVGPEEIVASHRESSARFGRTQHLLTGHDVTQTPTGCRIVRLDNKNVWKAGSGFASMAATLGRP